MNSILECPPWADMPAKPGTLAAALRQLVNAAGPLAGGMAVALNMVLRAEQAEADGQDSPLDARQRSQLIALCAVTAQMLDEVALDACNDLVSAPTPCVKRCAGKAGAA